MRALRPAHPRSRGENGAFRSRLVCCGGSSPLTRGKPCQHRAPVPHAGLIPAHAGKTARRRCPCANAAAHPRSREENLWEDRIRALEHGSSPLTRGKQLRVFDRELGRGLIPAHAGKTFASTPKSIHGEAHPRSRGENAQADYGSTVERGSSPLTRGKRKGCGRDTHHTRLIPAHAGKTRAAPRPGRRKQAHPRSRGENGYRWSALGSPSGSSPLTRGKRGRGRTLRLRRGLIPAHAGKTASPRQAPPSAEAHPRSRGENP